MKIFARGYSEKLNILATKHRPTTTDLTFTQISKLCELAGYRISKLNDKMFTIFHPDGKHGLDNGLYVIWHVKSEGNELIYYPTLQAHYSRGKNHVTLDLMLDNLSFYLSKLGFASLVKVAIDEEIIALPEHMIHPDTYTLVMTLSEFQAKYRSLYMYLKENMLPTR